MDLRLRPFLVRDEVAAREAHAQLTADGFRFLIDFKEDSETFSDMIERHERQRRGIDIDDGWVRGAFLAAEVDGELVGRASVRFDLNDFLMSVGGHVGYAVLPAFRRRGHATEILRQALVVVRSEGVRRVLITCAETNVGSARVIERCGGVFENVVESDNERICRYWID